MSPLPLVVNVHGCALKHGYVHVSILDTLLKRWRAIIRGPELNVACVQHCHHPCVLLTNTTHCVHGEYLIFGCVGDQEDTLSASAELEAVL
jgi:hypothetical protein